MLALDSLGPMVWSVESGRWSHHLEGGPGPLTRFRCSPRGPLVLGVGGFAEHLALWDVTTGGCIDSGRLSGGLIRQVALSRESGTLTACHGDTLSPRGQGP